MASKFSIGIDLGTTNSVLAYAPLGSERPEIQVLPIPQVVAPGQIEAQASLPSFLYLPDEAEIASGTLLVPGGNAREPVIGSYARRISAEQPERTIAAAKSWLSFARVDRKSPILPWGAGSEIAKLSPVDASRLLLRHLVLAWQHAQPDAPLAEQLVTLTVPASFDVVARELTREAALAAGLPEDFILLEEPQAAVYHWVATSGDHWRRKVSEGDVLLVVDVGGGTSDLTLVRVEQEAGELVLRRLAVGDHLLVGGDNMDVALAHFVAGRFAEKGMKLNAWQAVSLWHACRRAKESLLATDGKATESIALLGRGSRLVGGTVTVDVEKQEVQQLLVDGFFPEVPASARPDRTPASGFQELGLPYEADTAITRHVAAFLGEHFGAATQHSAAAPQDPGTVQAGADQAGADHPATLHLLLNGGVFKSPQLRERLSGVISSWSLTARPTAMLGSSDELDRAVACGAAYYGWAKRHGGVRIRGGTARSYYVGIETAGLAIPGMPRPLQAVCVVPQAMEEGTELDVPAREVGLIVGKPARFRFFASSRRKQDRVGTVLKQWDEEELEETAPMELVLPVEDGSNENFVPVRFHSKLSELGVFELWCNSTRDEQRWKLEFNVREDAGGA
jgi:actin-like ATPase involved in cell morphogenesis